MTFFTSWKIDGPAFAFASFDARFGPLAESFSARPVKKCKNGGFVLEFMASGDLAFWPVIAKIRVLVMCRQLLISLLRRFVPADDSEFPLPDSGAARQFGISGSVYSVSSVCPGVALRSNNHGTHGRHGIRIEKNVGRQVDLDSN